MSDAVNTGASTVERARALVELKRLGEATSLLRAHLASEPNDADALLLLSHCLLLAGDTDGAIDAAEACANEVPDSAAVYRQLSVAYSRDGRLRDSTEAARAAARFDPHDPLALAQLAFALSNEVTGRRPGAGKSAMKDEACQVAQRAVDLAPHNVDCLRSLAAAQRASGKRDQARATLRRALATDPHDATAQAELARDVPTTAAGLATSLRRYVAILRQDPADEDARSGFASALRLLLSRAVTLILGPLVVIALILVRAVPGSRVPTLAIAGGLLAACGASAIYLARVARSLPDVARRQLLQRVRSPRIIVGLILLLAGILLVEPLQFIGFVVYIAGWGLLLWQGQRPG